MHLIRLDGVSKTYAGDGADVIALDGVDLVVEPGEFLGVMGPSGSGKSTLLHMMGALDTPDTGSVILDGRELATLSRADLADIRRDEVGVVFQFFNLVSVLTVSENIVLPALLGDGGGAANRARSMARVDELIATLGLDGTADKFPSQMSGGEQQRVAIARALVNSPKVLLADEPTGNLDRRAGLGVMDVLTDLHTRGQTIVIVTHDPAVASYAGRVVFMRDGALVDEMRLDRTGDPAPILAKLSALEA